MIPIKSSVFGVEHLKLHSVWTWQQDLFVSEDSLVPVSLTEEGLAEAESLLIHSRFLTRSGKELEGIIIYQLGDDDVFAVEIFAEGRSFTLNKNLPDRASETLKELASVLGDDVENIMPVKYSIVPKELVIEDGFFSF